MVTSKVGKLIEEKVGVTSLFTNLVNNLVFYLYRESTTTHICVIHK